MSLHNSVIFSVLVRGYIIFLSLTHQKFHDELESHRSNCTKVGASKFIRFVILFFRSRNVQQVNKLSFGSKKSEENLKYLEFLA